MEHRKFKKILGELKDDLTSAQIETLNKALANRGDLDEICRLIEQSFERDKKCTHCGEKNLQRCGKSSGLQRWLCMTCNRSFNALTGTSLAHLRHKERWLGYMRALIDGLSVRKSAAESNISTNTSFRWRHRFLERKKQANNQLLNGIGEVDETFFRESFKGLRNMPRKAKKRGQKASRPGLSKEQIPVLIARDRHGSHIDAVLPDRSKKAVSNVLKGRISKDTILCTESDRAIIAFAKDEELQCEVFVASAGEHGRGYVHVQNVNGYISRLKKWMARFNGVATKYLASYLGWRRMLDLRGPIVTPENCLLSAFC